ncbi:MAG TPA: DUF423 domain-containing protein [Flavobacteriaceae bacterium]|nr:DUF423 domain-containing protein [Flavobacteriaceae bacterium]
MKKLILVTGTFFGATAVILGAFGAHMLSENLSPNSLASFETGMRYQMYHALLLILIGLLNGITPKTKKIVLFLLAIGVVLFSGSIYLLATNALTSFDFTSIALLTPLGGLLLISAWIVLGMAFLKSSF